MGRNCLWQGAYEDPEGYVVSFLFPVNRVSLRNPRIDPHGAIIVEIMQGDDSRPIGCAIRRCLPLDKSSVRAWTPISPLSML